jgi:hypothetical protein
MMGSFGMSILLKSRTSAPLLYGWMGQQAPMAAALESACVAAVQWYGQIQKLTT